jgi:hypothetical protein
VNWTPVTEDEARLHPLYGFGGWLYGVYAVEVLGLALTLEGVIRVVSDFGIEQLANPGFGVIWLHLALNLPFLLMAPMKARAMPMVSIVCYWVGMLFSMGMFLTMPGPLMDVSILARVLFWVAWGVVFTLYLLRSRRVNVTYRHRVRADEPAPAVPPLEGAA